MQHISVNLLIERRFNHEQSAAAAQEVPASHTLSASGLGAEQSHWDQCTVLQECSEQGSRIHVKMALPHKIVKAMYIRLHILYVN